MTPRAINAVLLSAFAVFLLTAPWALPAIGGSFWVNIVVEILIWSLLAASVNLLFGYVGLLSFGQALYFGFGMFGVAIGIAKLGLGFWSALGFGVSLAVGMGVVAGIFAVRLTWHYFAIITVVFSLIFYFLALTLRAVTGGDDGTSFVMPPTFVFGDTVWSFTSETFQYYSVLAAVALCFYSMHRLIESPLGKAFIAIRENDTRASLIGLNVYGLRLASFVIAAFYAGVSGALFALFGRYASASYMFYHVSGEAVVWTIVGGTGTLLGPIVGAGLFIIMREELSTHWQHHALLVGIIAILIVSFAPQGIVGLWRHLLDKWAGQDNHDDADAMDAAALPEVRKLDGRAKS